MAGTATLSRRATYRASRFRVRAAFFAAADLWARLRRRAADFAWRDSAEGDAALLPSRFSARRIARPRFGDDRRDAPRRARLSSRAACRRVRSEVPLPGEGSFTPARRAFESPMAIACFVERAPCLPSRM